MGMIGKLLKKNGVAVSNYYAQSEIYFDLTPAGRTLINSLSPLMDKYLTGTILDAGAGRLTYQSRLQNCGEKVISIDRYRVQSGLDLAGDLQHLPFASQSFDAIFCTQVLEHVPDPCSVLKEFHRVLRNEGMLVLTAPHLAYLHNEPWDFYRYTEFGLRQLLNRSSFEVVEVHWSGGILSFLGHIPSTLVVNLFWTVPILSRMVVQLNRIWSRGIAWLEGNDCKMRRFALNMVVVARKLEDGRF